MLLQRTAVVGRKGGRFFGVGDVAEQVGLHQRQQQLQRGVQGARRSVLQGGSG